MSVFLKAWPVKWSRLCLPVVRGPEHPYAKGCYSPVEDEGALGLLCVPED